MDAVQKISATTLKSGGFMFAPVQPIVGPYRKPPASFEPYDPRAPRVAAGIIAAAASCLQEVPLEHIGSTAVEGCPGKGIIDLMALYPEGCLELAVAMLRALGFQRQGKEFRNRFPDERPVMMGTCDFDGTPFLAYVHVIRKDAGEAGRFRIFRDRLAADGDLRTRYVAEKKRIIASGVVDTDDYAIEKQAVIEAILKDDY
jgi:GrpB-like predicted nucleotidyltransferase (UPF0157 family)